MSPLQAIQTNRGLAAVLEEQDSLIAISEEAAQDCCETSCIDLACDEGSPAEVRLVVPRTQKKNTRCQRRAKRKRLLMEANGVQKTVVRKGARNRALGALGGGSTRTFATIAREDLQAAEGGWMGSQEMAAPGPQCSLEMLLQRGLRLVEWDGMTPHAILDTSGYVVAVLAGRAAGTFHDVLRQATSEFQSLSANLPPVEERARGYFYSAVTGVSCSGGQQVPMNSAESRTYKNAVRELRESNAMCRLAGYQNHAFKMFFPKIHEYYETHLSKLYSTHPHLRRPYANSIMPAAAYNLGPATICRPHRDSDNLSFGICAITALGNFDHKAGGHLALRELGLVVEFPPGATVLIPSAAVTHYNVKISDGERRYSFTQYAAGTIFGYIENGMRSEQELLANSLRPVAERQRHAEARRDRWRKGLALFPHISEYTVIE